MDEMSVASIVVGDRFRKDMGDLAALAQSIQTNGLLQPIVVDARRNLVCGARRLAAIKMLGHEVVAVKKFDCGSALTAEHDENVMRKAFTTSEQVAIADAVAEELAGRVGRPNNGGNISTINDEGKTRDIAAAKAGLGSGKTYEAAKRVVESGAPALVEAMDAGLVSISGAARLSSLPASEQEAIDYTDKVRTKAIVSNVQRRQKRVEDKEGSQADEQPAPDIRPSMARLYEDGSSLSAYVLARRAITAISQIGKHDPNAIAAIESIQAALNKQTNAITKE